MQEIINGELFRDWIAAFCKDSDIQGVFLVCGKSFCKTRLYEELCQILRQSGVKLVHFHGFLPNPEIASVQNGVAVYAASGCDFILAAGGGSAIDVAKCIRLFYSTEQGIAPDKIPFAAIPTTAGSGSEATHFAVVYQDGQKKSITDGSCRPQFVILEPSLLETLPDYQKKVTLLDAMCHAVESYWSVKSTELSKAYSAAAICTIRAYQERYLANHASSFGPVLWAAHMAGKAIDVAQTTAAHAMSYQLTKSYGIAHGHAVGICLPKIWRYARRNMELCADPRGPEYLNRTMDDLRTLLGCAGQEDVPDQLERWISHMGLKAAFHPSEDKLLDLARTVNLDRLKNTPINLCSEQVIKIYRSILTSTE